MKKYVLMGGVTILVVMLAFWSSERWFRHLKLQEELTKQFQIQEELELSINRLLQSRHDEDLGILYTAHPVTHQTQVLRSTGDGSFMQEGSLETYLRTLLILGNAQSIDIQRLVFNKERVDTIELATKR